MPTITAEGSVSLTNLGPLTTTFTPAATCTSPVNVYLAPSGTPSLIAWGSDCVDGLAQVPTACIPSGKQMNALTTKRPEQWPYAYFSPGLDCPSNWYTAGVAARNSDGSISSTGMFAPFTTPVPVPLEVQFGDWAPNIMMNALDKDETIIACCPSGYSVRAPAGDCYKPVARSYYTETTACELILDGTGVVSTTVETFDFYGSTITATMDVDPTTNLASSITTITLHPTGKVFNTSGDGWIARNLIAVDYVDALTLYRKAEDSGATGTSTGTAKGTATGALASASHSSAAAPGVSGRSSSVAAILGIWTLAAVAGACLMMPL